MVRHITAPREKEKAPATVGFPSIAGWELLRKEMRDDGVAHFGHIHIYIYIHTVHGTRYVFNLTGFLD